MEGNLSAILSFLYCLVRIFNISHQVNAKLWDLFTQFTCRSTSGTLEMLTLNFAHSVVLLGNWLLLWSYRISSCYFTLEEGAQRRNWKPAGIYLWFYCELTAWGRFLAFSVCWSEYSPLKAYLPRCQAPAAATCQWVWHLSWGWKTWNSVFNRI